MNMISHDLRTMKENALCRQLVLALESARTKLAIAVATEAKATSLERWSYYLDTAEQIRRCVKRLRRQNPAASLGHSNLLHALDSLERFPAWQIHQWHQSEALNLCRFLRDVVAELK